jgi:hypothetical protein
MRSTVAVIIAAFLFSSFFVAAWTQDNLEYVLALLVHHAVHVPYLIALFITVVTSVGDLMFDIVVSLLRASNVI